VGMSSPWGRELDRLAQFVFGCFAQMLIADYDVHGIRNVDALRSPTR
jgi:hypothetical protein